MNQIIQSSLSNIAIIFLMHLCCDILIKKRHRYGPGYFLLGMITIISASVIIMFYLPIKFGGYHLDLRWIPLVMLAYKWGGKLALPTLLITSIWRLCMGSAGAVPGVIFGMMMPVLVGLIFRRKLGTAPKIGMFPLFWLIFISWFVCDIPIIFIVPKGLMVFYEIAFLRIITFMLTGFTLNFFISNTEKELRMREKLHYLAERDPLTSLYNIRFFETKLKSYTYTKKYKYIIMIDIDHFKIINDTYGHLNGDYILKKVAKVIVDTSSKFGKIDTIIGRYGGEEFIIFADAPFNKDVVNLVEDIRQEIEEEIFYTEDFNRKIRLTVSIGVSELEDFSHFHRAVELADQCLYKSKKNGRNQVHFV
ncbi:GGDEF domain-containing protein [Cytobacillus sp. Hz8]|uniref:GGDEF domain-containing protein n=1 Tax=Cytobacillus sp. Hz8 TaxID=3347168 RepID=UPI0035D5B7A2